MHGDLRGPNILVDHERRVRVADFGLANFGDSTSGSGSAHATGAIGWTAPELLSSAGFETENPRSTTYSDIYSFGSVCWEIYTGKVPFHEFRMVQALSRIINGHRPSRPSGDREMRQGLWAMVKACWRHNPLTRPSAQKILDFLDDFLQDPKLLPNFPPTPDSIVDPPAEHAPAALPHDPPAAISAILPHLEPFSLSGDEYSICPSSGSSSSASVACRSPSTIEKAIPDFELGSYPTPNLNPNVC